MATTICSINFFGHGDPSIAGTQTISTARSVRLWNLGAVKESLVSGCTAPNKTVVFYDYNAAFGEAKNRAMGESICSRLSGNETVFLITGYSAGGISAIYMAQTLMKKGKPVFYVGLADPAFQRGENDSLIATPGVDATYKKNYFQTKGNGPDIVEIHDAVIGFTNFDLSSQVGNSSSAADLHEKAVKIGNKKMFEDVTWCIKNC